MTFHCRHPSYWHGSGHIDTSECDTFLMSSRPLLKVEIWYEFAKFTNHLAVRCAIHIQGSSINLLPIFVLRHTKLSFIFGKRSREICYRHSVFVLFRVLVTIFFTNAFLTPLVASLTFNKKTAWASLWYQILYISRLNYAADQACFELCVFCSREFTQKPILRIYEYLTYVSLVCIECVEIAVEITSEDHW